MKYLLLLSLLILVPKIHAMTGRELVIECREAQRISNDSAAENPNLYSLGHCIGLVSGVRDTVQMWSYDNTTNKMPHVSDSCVPDNVTTKQVIALFLKWADAQPERLGEDASIAVVAALKSAYRCTR